MGVDFHNFNVENPEKGLWKSELPILAFKVQVGFGQVGDLHFFSVPVKAFTGELAGYNSKA